MWSAGYRGPNSAGPTWPGSPRSACRPSTTAPVIPNSRTPETSTSRSRRSPSARPGCWPGCTDRYREAPTRTSNGTGVGFGVVGTRWDGTGVGFGVVGERASAERRGQRGLNCPLSPPLWSGRSSGYLAGPAIRVIDAVCFWPLVSTQVSETAVPGWNLPMMAVSAFEEPTDWPLTAVMMSPAVTPTEAAGVLGNTLQTSAPELTGGV